MNYFNKKESKVEKTDNTDNTDIIVTYLSRIDDNYINHNFKDLENNMYICKECNNENILYKQHEREIYCSKCGYTEKIMINNENIYYKDNPKDVIPLETEYRLYLQSKKLSKPKFQNIKEKK